MPSVLRRAATAASSRRLNRTVSIPLGTSTTLWGGAAMGQDALGSIARDAEEASANDPAQRPTSATAAALVVLTVFGVHDLVAMAPSARGSHVDQGTDLMSMDDCRTKFREDPS